MSNPTVCLSFDFDAISLWIGPMGAKSPSMISRGEFGAVGVMRILRLLEREAIPHQNMESIADRDAACRAASRRSFRGGTLTR